MTQPDLNTLNPTRLLICGDWHGDTPHMQKAITYAAAHNIDAIIHVGDLGWAWNPTPPTTFDIPLENTLAKHNLTMIWADGNHDNHHKLRTLPRRNDGFTECSPHLYWSPRGNRWTWHNRTFATLGGAYSIDAHRRTPGWDHFPHIEEVQPHDLKTLGPDKVDILITHDIPHNTPVHKQFPLPPHLEKASDTSRRYLQKAAETTHPHLIFAGHWHQRLTHTHHYTPTHPTHIEILHQNGHDTNAIILDLTTLTVHPTHNWA